MFAQVIVDIASSQIDRIFDYKCEKNVLIGSRVLVPFANRKIEGYVVSLSDSTNVPESKIKPIISILDQFPIITEEQMKIAEFMKKTYHVGYADVFRLFLPSELRSGKVQEIFESFVSLADINFEESISSLRKNASAMKNILVFLHENGMTKSSEINKNFGSAALKKLSQMGFVVTTSVKRERTPYKETERQDEEKITLTSKQTEVIETIISHPSRSFLLHGVTGSGKTEVYMRVIESVRKQGKTAIMLVPEISLTPQILSSFRNRFGDDVALIHSSLSAGERFDEWKRIVSGDANIVVGARSAIFSPLSNIGAIIIDEEHEQSYVSETNPRYVTSDIAEVRKNFNNCILILGSATPSIVSYHKAIIGEYRLLEMKERINGQNLPPINIVDMGLELRLGNPDIFSNILKDSLQRCIEEGNQAILFLNRRGFASFLQCRDCGWIASCPNCEVALVYHKAEEKLKCHFCGNRFHMFDECPTCHGTNLKSGAIGTQRVVDEIHKMFPKVSVLRMDNDTTSTKDSHRIILDKFRKGDAQILVGTQMVAKGHDFPSVTLVGIIEPDNSLHQSNFMATEKTFSLLIQVAGRAGRSDKNGEIILQTYSPKHYVYKLASFYDYLAFYNKEINIRNVTKYPPFAKIVRILFTSQSEELAISRLKVYYDYIESLRSENPGDFVYLNKMKSPIGRIKNKFRFQILMRLEVKNCEDIIDKIFEFDSKHRDRNIVTFIETNPQNLS